jgi:hypothetical protein
MISSRRSISSSYSRASVLRIDEDSGVTVLLIVLSINNVRESVVIESTELAIVDIAANVSQQEQDRGVWRKLDNATKGRKEERSYALNETESCQ